jgi:hypothetical protein
MPSVPTKRPARVFLWAALVGVVGTFLALGIILLITCLRLDDTPPGPSLAETLSSFEPQDTGQSPPDEAPATQKPVTAAPAKTACVQLSPQDSSPPPDPDPDPDPQPIKSPPPDAAVKTEAPALPVFASAKGEPLPEGLAATAKHAVPVNTGAIAKEMFLEHPTRDPAVNRAIDRGIKYLKKADDFRIGGKAMAGLTLLSCGVPAKDAAVKRFARDVRNGLLITATYELALCLLFLDRLGDPQDEASIRRIALQLIAGQGILGGWNYHCFALSPKQEKKLLTLLQAPVRWTDTSKPVVVRMPRDWQNPTLRTAVPAGADLRNLPVMQYRPGQPLRLQASPRHEDNSLTQFVILALWRAQQHGVPAERSLAMIEARFRASQNSDGSWAYKWGPGFLGGNFRVDSMTCAGLLGLAVGHAIQPSENPDIPVKPTKAKKLKAEGDPAIEKALRFLSQKIGAPRINGVAADQLNANAQLMNLQLQLAHAPPAQRLLLLERLMTLVKIDNRLKAQGTIISASARGDLYYLWSLERVAVAYDLRTIGGKDWYAWGAPLIVGHQQEDGSWSDLYPGVPDTCFALLFLKRVNVARDLTRSLQRLMLSREAAGRTSDQSLQEGSPGERTNVAEPKGPPLRTRE